MPACNITVILRQMTQPIAHRPSEGLWSPAHMPYPGPALCPVPGTTLLGLRPSRALLLCSRAFCLWTPDVTWPTHGGGMLPPPLDTGPQAPMGGVGSHEVLEDQAPGYRAVVTEPSVQPRAAVYQHPTPCPRQCPWGRVNQHPTLCPRRSQEAGRYLNEMPQ